VVPKVINKRLTPQDRKGEIIKALVARQCPHRADIRESGVGVRLAVHGSPLVILEFGIGILNSDL